MKTPRDVLLERHRAADAKLNAIREAALAGMPKKSSSSVSAPPRFLDLLFPVRWHLTGIAAAWVIVAVLNIDYSAVHETMKPKLYSSSPQELMVALAENRRQVLELIEASPPEPTISPRSTAPRRRSEAPCAVAVA
jgi:hypothetical protein